MKYLDSKYDFLLEREFNYILDITVNESGKWVNDNTYEWNIKNEKRLKEILSKLDKESIIRYFEKFVNFISGFPKGTKKKVLVPVMAIFLSFVSAKEINSSDLNIKREIRSEIDSKLEEELEKNKDKEKGISFDKAQKIVKSVEGGYTDDKDDRGNWVGGELVGTNHGISAPVLKTHFGRLPTKKEMEDLDYSTAENIYKNKYWNRNNLNLLNNQKVANIIYDGVVNQGRRGSKLVIQKVLKDFDLDIKMRNIFSPETIKKINKLDQTELFNKIYDYRWERYEDSRNFDKYGDGWKNRLDNFK